MSHRKQKIDPLDWAFLFYWMMATTLAWLVSGILLPSINPLAVGPAVGLLQWLVLYKRIDRAWRWILASAAGWIAAGMLVLVAVPPSLGGALLGLGTGLAQWIILRREVHWAGWWIAASTLGWTTGLMTRGPFLPAIIPAVMTGITLEILMRYPLPKKESTNLNLSDQL